LGPDTDRNGAVSRYTALSRGSATTDSQSGSPAIDLETTLRVLKRRRWLILLCFVLVTGGTVGYSLSQQKKYSATAHLLFRDPGFDQKFFGAPVLAPSSDPQRQAETNVGIVSLEQIGALTAKVLGPDLGARVGREVTVQGQGNSDLAAITATDPNPRDAALIANTYATQYIDFRRAADRATIARAEQLVLSRVASLPPAQKNGPVARQLASQASQLQVLAGLQTGNAELVQPALVPTAPSSPTPRRDGIVAAIVGLLLGFGLAIGFERLDRRLNDPEELEAALQLPLLGIVPTSPAYSHAKDGHGKLRLPGAEAEAFRLLRARLRYFDVDHPIRTVLITSAAPGDGKTTVALHLAAAAATSGSRVLLIEADLRRPSLAKELHIDRKARGLVQALVDPSDDGLRDDVAVISTDWNRTRGTFDVVVAGGVPPNPSELIESERMVRFLKRMARSYDLIVIDSTPLPVVSDAIPLLRQVDGVVVVGRVGVTTRLATKRLRDQLVNLHAPVLGVVANAISRSAWGYYGNQYDGYVPPPITDSSELDSDELSNDEPSSEEPESAAPTSARRLRHEGHERLT
jgi:capsular exopolysaccharide synthesis family protein